MGKKIIAQLLSCLLMLPSFSLIAARRSDQSTARVMRQNTYSRGETNPRKKMSPRGATQGGRRSSRGDRYDLVRGRGSFQSGSRRLPMGGRFAREGRISRGRVSRDDTRSRGSSDRMSSRADRYAGRGRSQTRSRSRGPVQQEYYDEYIDEESVDQLPEKVATEVTAETEKEETKEEAKDEEEKKEEVVSWDAQFSVQELRAAVVELQKNKAAYRREKQTDGFALSIAPEQYDALIKKPLPSETFGDAKTMALIELHNKINDYLAAPGLPKGSMNTITFKENEPHLLTKDDKKAIATTFELYDDYEKQWQRVRPAELQKRKKIFEEILVRLSDSEKKKITDALDATATLLNQKKSHLAKLSIQLSDEVKAMSVNDLSEYLITQMSERREATLDGWSTGLSGGHFWGTIYQSYADPFGERAIMLERAYHEFYFACMTNSKIIPSEREALFGTMGDSFDYELVETLKASA